jgi:hypothetical protein
MGAIWQNLLRNTQKGAVLPVMMKMSRMIDDCEATGAMIIGRRKRNTLRKPASMSLIQSDEGTSWKKRLLERPRS